MKKILIVLSFVLMLAVGCSNNASEKKSNNQEAKVTQPNSSTNPDVPKDYTLTTQLPDGRQRIEGKLLEIKEGNVYLLESLGGNKEVKMNEKMLNIAGKLNIKINDVVILTINDGVVDSIEKVSQ